MIYYIYKITNILNNHFYIGRRAYKGINIDEDQYFGSGKRLKLAIKKYGKENFIKTIIKICDSEKDLIESEKSLVTEELVNDIKCYNLALGGHGGYTYYAERIIIVTDETKLKISKANKGRKRPDVSERIKRDGFNNYWKNKKRTEEDKKNKSKAALKASHEGRSANVIKIICPHCSKVGNIGNMKRWHFDNCKSIITKEGNENV